MGPLKKMAPRYWAIPLETNRYRHNEILLWRLNVSRIILSLAPIQRPGFAVNASPASMNSLPSNPQFHAAALRRHRARSLSYRKRSRHSCKRTVLLDNRQRPCVSPHPVTIKRAGFCGAGAVSAQYCSPNPPSPRFATREAGRLPIGRRLTTCPTSVRI